MTNTKQKSPVSLRIPDELQKFLAAEAAKGYRSFSQEIVMRLEMSRQADQQTTRQKGQQQ